MKSYRIIYSLAVTMILLTLGPTLTAQVDPQLSQPWMRRLVFNPASIEKGPDVNVYGLARQQWSGFENAPSSQLIAATTYFEKYHVGLGLSIMNDMAGVSGFQNVKLNYSYNFWLNEEMNLTFGAGMGFISHQVKTSNLVYEDPADPAAASLEDSRTQSDFDIGAEFRMNELRAGLSVLHFLKSTKHATNFTVPRHYYFYASYRLEATDMIDILPTITMRTSGNVCLFGVSAVGNYNDQFMAGFDYRINDAFAILAKIAITPYLYLGYSYDLDSGVVRSYNSGSHEISIQTRLSKGNTTLRSPRFFD